MSVSVGSLTASRRNYLSLHSVPVGEVRINKMGTAIGKADLQALHETTGYDPQRILITCHESSIASPFNLSHDRIEINKLSPLLLSSKLSPRSEERALRRRR